jgi:NADH:ubiquinone oxidoreductase subunit H
MGPFDWNILELSLYIYNRFLEPQLSNWGVFEFVHYLTENLYLWSVNLLPEFLLKTVSTAALVMTFKFIVLIALLIFIRGGVPRYRYDFLTKIGWIKFLSLVLAVFLSSLLLTLLF